LLRKALLTDVAVVRLKLKWNEKRHSQTTFEHCVASNQTDFLSLQTKLTFCRYKPNWLFVATNQSDFLSSRNRLCSVLNQTDCIITKSLVSVVAISKLFHQQRFAIQRWTKNDVDRKTTLTSCDSSKFDVFKSAFEMGIFGLESYVEKNCRDAFYEVDIRLLIEK
jgi:hypothetical protein